MSRPLFLRIVNEVEQYDPYFIQRTDAVGVLGLSSLQKITAAYRILAYETPADSVDEYIRIGESTAIESLRRFVKAVIAMFGDHYLRSPNNIDIARLLQTGEQRGFPGMLGSIDCMHWKWKNCPTTWQGMYTGHCHEPTIILEAVVSRLPDPNLTRLADPNRIPGRDTIYTIYCILGLSLTCSFSELYLYLWVYKQFL